MVRRTSKKSKRKKKEEVNTGIEALRRETLERIRRDQERWVAEYMQAPLPEERRIHIRFEPINHAPGEPHCLNECFENHVVLITGCCAICSQILTEGFPEDYPDEWKFCCSCLAWAKHIISDIHSEWIINGLDRSPIIRKIYKRITLSGEKKL